MQFFTPHRHKAASVAPMKGLRPHSVSLNPAFPPAPRTLGNRENDGLRGEYFRQQFFDVLTGTNS